MAQPADDQKDVPNVWPTALLSNQAYALNFSCVKCNGIPMSCMNNEEGEILCAECAKNVDNTSPIKAVQNMINKLKTKCLSLAAESKQSISNDVEGGSIVITEVKDNQCGWTGIIKEWNDHNKECEYIAIKCDECKQFECARKLMAKHMAQCPEATINCPLSCGCSILRKNAENHLSNDCAEQLMDCRNDDCKMQIKRKDFDSHINNECDTRMVECEFVKYGCNTKQIKWNQLESHMNEYKFQHISNKFDFITTGLNAEIDALKTELNALKGKQSKDIKIITEQFQEIEEKQQDSSVAIQLNAKITDTLTTQLNEQLQEMEEKKQDSSVAIAEWKSTKREGDHKPILWNTVALKSTLDGMATAVNRNRAIQIGVHGLYRIDVRCQYTGTFAIYDSSTSKFSLKVNDNIIAEAIIAEAIGIKDTLIPASMAEIVQLKKGDRLSVWCTVGSRMSTLTNHFILQKLC